ncbi:biogenesis of lysosome-related organelles complex 1 subunit 5-like [Physella acuta]|uniref:biogenesis of lysosome-related organelles complex 1 subunit 5-like n=1 Tax=Physella acuta TaxID=109671 RepID=UPI0027DE78C7|nr:biogenesis of lysosome-related organelles complex 1 subunit 5-like [Physella acuta]XP_059158012.1 biogenesis of lysosome-related organelles complex 1 subunit 5-like [Physella acuta]XP_059158013.1 biogenesis of lysosome-related organelles complex 1 subunit 5-like [Physella acuta]XP_059158014.1 biogenesis of lysosome-related organelles complex 1 subunit 5-like [Physella acuta]
MTCEFIFRDATDIYSRLFNHRAALQGLTNNFVKEFEEKRGEKEIISLSRTHEVVLDCRDRALPSSLENLNNNVTLLKESVTKTLQMSQRILQDSDEKKVDWIESQRQIREQQWNEFMQAQVVRSSRVDTEFKNKIDSLKKHYTELEDKLKEGANKVL